MYEPLAVDKMFRCKYSLFKKFLNFVDSLVLNSECFNVAVQRSNGSRLSSANGYIHRAHLTFAFMKIRLIFMNLNRAKLPFVLAEISLSKPPVQLCCSFSSIRFKETVNRTRL